MALNSAPAFFADHMPVTVTLLVLLLAPPVAGDVLGKVCSTTFYYVANSSYEENLHILATTLPKKASSSEGLFATATTGFTPNAVHSLAQCRGDIDASSCETCLTGAFEDAQALCSNNKDATIYYNLCVLRFSNQFFFHNIDTTFAFTTLIANSSSTMNNNDGFISSSSFDAGIQLLINSISNYTAKSPNRFATGVLQLDGGKRIFGLAQCTLNIAPSECHTCLANILVFGTTLLNGSDAGTIHVLWCSYTYGPFSFFSGSPLVQLQISPPIVGPAPTPSTTEPPPSSTNNGGNVRTVIIVTVVLAVALLLVFLLFLCKRNKEAHKDVQLTSGHGDEEMGGSLAYSLNILKSATSNFSEENKLGKGGFGEVYKGTLQDRRVIAVKRLSTNSNQGHVEMKNEVVTLANLQHRNLVRLLGYCIEEHERLLVYEFLPNNSLDKILFDPARQQELGWGLRVRIIEGIARGLFHLHQGSWKTIIHRDLKASNILLDAKMIPKISDFGLAKMFNIDSSVGKASGLVGTYGYMAPEIIYKGIISVKSDVFSYGVLLLEIITGRRNITFTPGSSGPSEDLITCVWRHWRGGRVQQLLENCPAEGGCPQEILRCIHIALLCVQKSPRLRPDMAAIIAMLNSHSTTLPSPTAPANVLLDSSVTTSANSPRGSRRSMAARALSINNITVTELYPR